MLRWLALGPVGKDGCSTCVVPSITGEYGVKGEGEGAHGSLNLLITQHPVPLTGRHGSIRPHPLDSDGEVEARDGGDSASQGEVGVVERVFTGRRSDFHCCPVIRNCV